ncbi:MAG: response regulator, partial [Deltaproteobacteria bacterium]
LKLPKMSGVELCKLIRDKYPLSILFAVTGYASQFEFGLCRRAGFDDYFIKPVDLKILFRATLEAFDKVEDWYKRSRNI